jgi:SLT domain-containing protein/phage-related protein
MATNLPKVEQDFGADVSAYVTALQSAIGITKQFASAVNDATTAVNKLNAALKALPDQKNIKINLVGIDEALTKTAQLKKQINDIPKSHTTTVFVKYVAQGNTPDTAKAATQVVNQVAGTRVSPTDTTIVSATQSVLGSGVTDAANIKSDTAAMQALASQATRTNSTIAGLTNTINQNSGALGVMKTQSGGAAAGIVLTSAAAQAAAGWWRTWGGVVHWVIAAGAEFLAVFIPAMVAAGAAALVAAQAIQNIQVRMTSLFTVMEGLGGAFNTSMGQALGLGNAIQKMQNTMQPAVYELFGAVLNGVSGHLGSLAVMGQKVIQVLDTFAAKVDVELRGALGQQLTGLVAKGAQDLTMLGQVLGNLGHAFLNLAAAMPGLAEVLLRILVVFTDFLKIITSIPAPILTAAIAFEEFLRWGSLLVNVVGKLVTGFGLLVGALGGEKIGKAIADAGAAASKSGGSFGGLFLTLAKFAGTNPLIAFAVVAVAALTIFTVWIMNAKSGTEQWIASVNKAVQTAPDFVQVNTTINALAANTKNLGAAQDVLNTKTSAWSALASGAQQAVSALTQQHKQLTQDIFTETGDLGYLTKTYGVSMPTAIGLATGAGVKLTTSLLGNSQAAQVARQQIQNLITGYQALGQQGTQLTQDINAVTIANSNQLSSVQKINQAWTTVIGNMTGVQTSFLNVESGIATLQTDLKATGASFDGLNAASITMRQQFETNITNSATSVQSLNTALALGGVSTGNYRTAVAGLVQQQLPFTQGNAQAIAQLGAIASMAGYTGTSYTQLKAWVDKYGTSQNGVNTIMANTTIAMSNINQMAGKLTGTLQTDVINSTAQAALAQGGFQAELNKTTKALESGGPKSTAFKDDLKQLDGTLRGAGFTAQQVTQYNQFLEKQFGNTGDAAKSAGSKVGALGQGFDQQKIAASGLRDQVKNVFEAIGHYVEAGANVYKNIIKTEYVDAGKALVTAWHGLESAAKTIWHGMINDIVDPIKTAISQVKNAFTGGFDGWWKTHGDEIKQIWSTTWNTVKSIFESIANLLTGSSGKFWNGLVGIARAAWGLIGPVVKTGWDLISNIFKATIAVLTGIFKIWWDSLVAVARIAWDGIKTIVKIGWDTIVAIFNVALDLITGHWHRAWTDVKAYGEQVWNALKAYFTDVWNILKTLSSQIWNAIKTTTIQYWNDMKSAATAIWNNVKAFFTTLWNDIKTTAESIWNAIKAFMIAGWNQLVATGKTIFNGLKDFLSTTWNNIRSTTESVWNAIWSVLNGLWNRILGIARTLWDDLKRGFTDVVNGIQGAWGRLQNIFQGPVNFLIHTVYDNGIARLWNDVASAIGIGKLPLLAEGGKIHDGTSPTADDVLVRVSKGETVVSAAHSQQLAPIFAAAGVPGYAPGGIPSPGRGGALGAGNPTGPTFGPLQGFVNKIKDIAGLTAALLTGNSTAFVNDLMSLVGTGGAVGELGQMIVGIPKTLIKDVGTWIAGKGSAKGASMGGGGGFSSVPARSGSAAAAQAFAAAHLGQFGWGANQMPSLIALWNQESGWSANAVNKSSGAYGIPQALGHGHPYALGDYANQVLWGLNYIKQRYGSPSAAEAHERAFNWYAGGGVVGDEGKPAYFTPTTVGAGLWSNYMYGALSGMGDMGTLGTNTAAQAASQSAAAAAVAKTVQSAAGGAVKTGATSYPNNIAGWMAHAVALTGVPSWWIPDLEIISRFESANNPNAINNWDSNARAGDPSRGLMQTIWTTFAGNHQAGTSWNIYDPVANIAAAIKYIESRYGNVANVPGVRSVLHGGGYVGYDSGGYLMPGITMAVNNTGKPERVTPAGGDGEGHLIHNVVNLDGKTIWENQQRYTLQYNVRNNGGGAITGAVRPR